MEQFYFLSNELQNNLVFQSSRLIEFTSNNTSIIESWDSTGRNVTRKNFKCPHTSDVNFAPKKIGSYRLNSIVTFKEICLKQDTVSFLHENMRNVYISCELDTLGNNLNTDFTLGNCGAIKLTKNAGPNNYIYSGYHLRCNSHSQYS